MSRKAKRRIITVVGAVIVAAGAWWLLEAEHSPVAFVIGLHRAINERARTLLYDVDHEALASVMRQFASEREWSSGQPPRSDFGDFVYFRGSDPSLPAALRLLKASSVRIFDDRVECEFGGAFLHFGVAAFLGRSWRWHEAPRRRFLVLQRGRQSSFAMNDLTRRCSEPLPALGSSFR